MYVGCENDSGPTNKPELQPLMSYCHTFLCMPHIKVCGKKKNFNVLEQVASAALATSWVHSPFLNQVEWICSKQGILVIHLFIYFIPFYATYKIISHISMQAELCLEGTNRKLTRAGIQVAPHR